MTFANILISVKYKEHVTTCNLSHAFSLPKFEPRLSYFEAPPYKVNMCKKVVIIGGGISGLTAAWYLARGSSRLNVTLLEGSSRIGGWINSDRIAHTGAVHELGPRSMRVAQTAGKIALAMVCLTYHIFKCFPNVTFTVL